jgi:C4-dicarboxylate-specific signal transduction histidine kinase
MVKAFEACRLDKAGEFCMALGSMPTRARIRWVRLRIPLHTLPDRGGRAAAQGGRGTHGPHRKVARGPLGQLAILQDLGGERRRERELRVQREQLTHLARVCLLGELSAALVHELNQPLAAILANAQAGRRLDGPAAAVHGLDEILDDIVTASQRAIGIIQRMRALFLRRDTQRQPLDLNTVARDAVALAQSSLAEHGVRLALALDPRAVLLRGDPVQLQQVLLNLILNACDAMDATPPGARRLAVSTVGGTGAQACVTVADNGAGIAPGLLERIFDSFFTTKPKGLGVGLSVSREIVAAHGGRIEAANRPEGGAVFRITLPMAGETHHE